VQTNRVSHFLRYPANSLRRLLIAAGIDDRFAEPISRNPSGLTARLLRPDTSLYRGSLPRRVTRDGIQFELDLSDYIEWTIYFGVERALKSRLYDLVQPGQTVLDVGSNVGEVVLNFARRAGPNGRVIGFEPNPTTLAKCRRNVSLNDVSNVELYPLALGDRPGEAILGRPAAGNAGADRVISSGSGVAVAITTLDLFADEQQLERVDVIKIDVEGFDLNVLRGSQRTIERFRPILFIELSDANLREQGDSAPDLVRWLEQHDCSVTDALTGEPVSSNDELGGCFRDIIATPI
jgi:FkbM family methyltransferase